MPDKMLFFDTGPIISLVMSRLVWILEPLKKQFGGHFYITPAVKKELVERPMMVKRFEFEAFQVLKLVHDGVLEEYNAVPQKRANELIDLANNTFRLDDKPMDVLQAGEVESVACAMELNAPVVMDERTLRLFIENNREMKKLLEIRFNKEVTPDLVRMNKFSDSLKGLSIIRSIELVSVAYKMGLLSDYVPDIKDGKERLLDSVLWATKFNGCAVTEHEIEEIKLFLLK